MKTRLQGLCAFTAIVAFLVGVPVALIAMTGSPIPTAWPTLLEVQHALTHPDDGTVLLGLLRVVVWAGWAWFAVSLLREIVIQLRHLRAPSLPRPGRQRVAAGLVSTAFLLFAGAPLASAATTPAAAPQAVTASWGHAHTQPSTHVSEPTAHSPATTDQVSRDYVVEPGDTLWGISDRKLGDGDRYPKLYRASEDTVQPDGKHLTDPDHIEPGWRITIPGKPATAHHTPTPGPDRSGSPRVQPQSVTGHQGETNGNGHTGASDSGRQATTRDAAPVPAATLPGNRTPAATAAPSHSSAPSRATELASPPATPAPTPPATTATPTPAAAVIDPSSAQDEVEGFPLRTVAGVGALLAGSFGAFIAARRVRQRRKRRPGQTLPMPDGSAAAIEAEVAAVADPFSVELVDRALRTLAAGCQQEHQPLPQLRAARLTHDTLDLYLAEPAQLPQPWSGTVDGSVWTLSAESAGLLPAAAAADAPFPSLVTIGQDSEGGHVLLDLEHVASLGILGDENQSLEVLTGLAVELATSQWADDVQVTVVGALPELEDCFQTGRVRYLPSAAVLMSELAARVHSDGQAMTQAGIDLNTARPAGTLTGLWTPEIVLVAHPLTDDQRNQLAQLLQTHPRAAVAAVTAQDALSSWAINLTNQPAILEPLDLAITPQRIDPATYQDLVAVAAIANEDPTPTAQEASTAPEIPLEDLLAGAVPSIDAPEPTPSAAPKAAPATPEIADSDTVDLADPIVDLRPASLPEPPIAPPPTPEPARTPQPAAPGAVDEIATEQETPPLIRVLGPVDVTGATGPIEATKTNACTEIAAFIALMPSPTPALLDQSLWPPDPDRPERSPEQIAKTRKESVSKLRRWLGTNPAGEKWLLAADAGSRQYGYLPGVTTDWHLFQQHIAAGLPQAPLQELEAALRLVRGQPFTRPTTRRSRRYCWADALQQEMITTITDTAYELGQRLLTQGRWRDAARAAAIGTNVDPVCQPLWRLRLKAAHCAGAAAEADDIIRRILADAAVYDDGELEEETAELVDAIRAARQSQPAP